MAVQVSIISRAAMNHGLAHTCAMDCQMFDVLFMSVCLDCNLFGPFLIRTATQEPQHDVNCNLYFIRNDFAEGAVQRNRHLIRHH